MSHFATPLALTCALLAACTAHGTEPLHVLGAGNKTCTQWASAGPEEQVEVLSWLTGFASAVHIMRASKGEQSNVEKLTYEYLRDEITAVCSHAANAKVDMFAIAFKLLGTSPQVRSARPNISLERTREK
jgi:hypothetical protein